METDRNHMTERMLNLTLEIIYLLTGENYIAFKLSDGMVASNVMKIRNPNIDPPSHSLRKDKKVQEVTSEMIGLLTGEVPIRSQDVTGYFSMEEWEYLEGHKDLYKDAMMENRPSPGGNQTAWRKSSQKWGEHANFMQEEPLLGPRTSLLQDGSSNRKTLNQYPRPLYSWDSTQEHQEIPQEHQVSVAARQTDCRAEPRKETQDSYVSGDGPCKEVKIPPETSTDPGDTREIHIDLSKEEEEEEEVICVKIEEDDIPIDISSDGRGSGYNPKNHHFIFPDGLMHDDITAKALQKNPITPNHHPLLLNADLLSHPSTYGGSLSNRPTPVTQNQDPKAVFMCSICGKCFAWKGSLVEHHRTHTGEKPYSCTECGKCFSKKTKLTLHVRTHTGERPFSCTECGKCFTRRDHLRIHQRTHTGVKPYSCTECGKSFSQRAFLIVHQRAHTGVKPYSCTECGKCFTGKAHLIVHQRTHTGEKPHSCPECGKNFTERSQLLRHRMSHAGVRPFSCPVCGRGFGSKSSLVRHQNLHTSNIPQTYST